MQTPLLLLALSTICNGGLQETGWTEKCLAELEQGRQVLRAVSGQLVAEEHHRQQEELARLHQRIPSPYYRSIRFAASATATPCPQPNATIFPRPTTSTTTLTTTSSTTTTTISTEATTVSLLSNPSSAAASESSSSSDEETAEPATLPDNPPAGSESPALADESVAFEGREAAAVDTGKLSRSIFVPSMFHTNVESDPYARWISKLHGHLKEDDEVCSGPAFKGLHTVTNHQLWGFVALLLSNHGSSFCPVCDGVIGRIEELLLLPNRILLTEEEQQLHSIILSFFPKRKAICSMLIPSCYADYETKAASNTTNSTICLRCSLCTAGLTYFQQRFLFDPTALKSALDWLDSSLFHNICAELCAAFPPGVSNPDSFFPNGVDYGECRNFTNEAFAFATNAAKNLLKPEFFCSTELGYCDVNATPNIMHCLKELCDEGLPVQFSSSICPLIPAETDLVSQYLNLNPAQKPRAKPMDYLRPNEKAEL